METIVNITIEKYFTTLEEIKSLPDGTKIYHEDGGWATKVADGFLWKDDFFGDELEEWEERDDGDGYAQCFSITKQITLDLSKPDGKNKLMNFLKQMNVVDGK